jgi:hypothetical protein
MDMIASRSKEDPQYPWINTKIDIITGKDFDDDDFFKGRNSVYAWIQGRGLEAIGTHLDWLKNDAETPVDEKSYADMVVVEGFTIPQIPSIVARSAQITGILAPLIGVSVVMQQNLSLLGAQEVVGGFVRGMGGYYAVLFTSMIIVFIAGMILESLPVTIILAPILAPIAASVGVDPIHFSVIFLVGASIGFITPPYGLNLYVASGVTGVPSTNISPLSRG